jgi:hypothetical protein
MNNNLSFISFTGIFLLTFVSIYSGQAQTETLSGLSKKGSGGFGSPIVEVSNITGVTGLSVGGGGAAIIGEFFFGGFGQGTGDGEAIFNNERYDVSLGVGGLWLGYTPRSHKLIHPYSSLKIGWGGVDMDLEEDNDNRDGFSDRITLIQPELGLELNITRWFRLAMTGGYRYVSGINKLPADLSNEDFRSFVGNLTFRFGGFPD